MPHPSVAQDQRFLALDLGSHGRLATRQNILSRCEQFRLTKEDALNLVETMKSVVSNWPAIYARAGLSEWELENLSTAFLHPGFEYE